MKNKLNKIAIVFLMLILTIPILSFNVGATESTINTSVLVAEEMGRSIIVRSDGILFSVIASDATPSLTKVFRSDDNGATWSENKTFSIGTNTGWFYPVCIGVDASDTIYCYYQYRSSTSYDIRLSKLTIDEQWSGATTVYDNPYTTSNNIVSMDCAFDSENAYLVWTTRDASYAHNHVYFRSYNFFFESWNTRVCLDYLFTYSARFFSPSISLFGDDKYVFYETLTGNEIEYACYHGHNDTWTTNHTLSDTAYVYYKPRSIVTNGKIYVFYHGTNVDYSDMAILYKVYDGTSWSSESVIHGETGYDQLDPCPSVNSDGTINVVWSGKSPDTTAYFQLRERIYSSGAWGDTAFVIGGAINKRYAHLCYQDYPTFTHLDSGLCIAYGDDTNNDFEYIDSGSLKWLSGAGDYSDFEFDANDNIGNLNTGCTIGISYKTVEFKYQVPTTINATGFDLLVAPKQHAYDSTLANYDLFINGEAMGNPTEWKEYSGKYVLRWTFAEDKVITNSEILFEVWHDVSILGCYWYVGASCGYNDLDGDGIATMRYSNTYPNGAFDGTWLAKDVAYQLYFNTISFVEDETDVTYNSITSTNSTYYVGETVPLTYTIKASDLVYDNYVRIWNDDTATEISLGSMQGFPYLCTHQVETIGFVPFTSANYTAHLYINAVAVDNVSFFANDHIEPDMHVFTYPNPSTVGQKIWVKYNYDHPTNRSGAIFTSLNPNLNSYTSVNYLSDGDNGFWTCTHNTVGVYYYIMAVDTTGNGTYGIVNNGIHAHYVRSEHGNNYFTLGGYNIRLNEEGTVTQTVNGECNMVTGNCYIYDNNQLIKTITESPFSYNYEIHTAGRHTVEMRLITNLTTILCTQNYTVTTYSGEDEIEQIEDSGLIVRDYIYNTYGDSGILVTALAILLTMTLLPLIIVLVMNVKYNKNIDIGDIHWSIYIVCAIIGVVIDVELHLIDLWVVLLICVGGIAIIVAIYYGRS